MAESSSENSDREVIAFMVPDRLRYGRSDFFTLDGSLKPRSWHDAEVKLPQAEKFCDGVYVFEAPYDWQLDDSGRFLYKPEFNHVANEFRENAGSSGGTVFNKLVEFLCNLDGLKYSDIRYKLNHENKYQTVALEQTVVVAMMSGEYRGRSTGRIFTGFGLGIVQAVLDGIDRSQYAYESLKLAIGSHLDVTKLGYLLIEHILSLYPDLDTSELRGKRLGDLLALLGVELKDFVAEPLFEDLFLMPDAEL